MKRAFAIFLCVCQPSWAAIALVHKSGDIGGVSPHATTITGSSAGNTLVCAVEIVDNTKVISSVVSNAGSGNTTFSESVGSKSTNSTLTTLMEYWYLFNAGAATSVTVTATASAGAVMCFEYSGTGSTVETQGAANNLAVAATLTGPAITTAVSNDVIAAACADSNNCTSMTAPYATDFLAENGHCSSDHIISGTVSSESAVAHDSTTGGGNCSAIAIEPPAAAATASPCQQMLGSGIACGGSL